MEENVRESYENRVNSFYSHYGKVIVEFELMCKFLRLNILYFLQEDGLKTQDLSRLMMADLSAYLLISKFRAIYALTYKSEPEKINHLDPFFKALLKINEDRNYIVHGNMLVPPANDHNINNNPELNSVLLTKDIVRKGGINYEAKRFADDDFKDLTTKITKATKILHAIQSSHTYKTDIIQMVKTESIAELK